MKNSNLKENSYKTEFGLMWQYSFVQWPLLLMILEYFFNEPCFLLIRIMFPLPPAAMNICLFFLMMFLYVLDKYFVLNGLKYVNDDELHNCMMFGLIFLYFFFMCQYMYGYTFFLPTDSKTIFVTVALFVMFSLTALMIWIFLTIKTWFMQEFMGDFKEYWTKVFEEWLKKK